MDEANPLTLLGILLILLGVVFVALPYLSHVVDVEKIPWVILYVYRRDGFTFATSPILLFLSALSFILAYARR
jgi:drug/metabolite transporter (DMT)-like permease